MVIRARAQGYADSGSQPGRTLACTGDYLYPASRLSHWPVVRAVRFAGFFEGEGTFAVGTWSRLPFRVFTLVDQRGQVREVGCRCRAGIGPGSHRPAVCGGAVRASGGH